MSSVNRNSILYKAQFNLISHLTFIIRKDFMFASLVYLSIGSEHIDLEQKQILCKQELQT